MKRALLPILSIVGLLAGASCSSEETTTGPASSDGGDAGGPLPDSSTGSTDAGGNADAKTDTGTTPDEDAGVGETCIGYGDTGDTCDTEQGKPYGYVCFGGAPPGVKGCKLTRTSGTLGNNYCCEENPCVEQIDQGAACNGVSGKPHRYQCPPDGAGNATPPAGCEEHNSGGSAVEKYYCCP